MLRRELLWQRPPPAFPKRWEGYEIGITALLGFVTLPSRWIACWPWVLPTRRRHLLAGSKDVSTDSRKEENCNRSIPFKAILRCPRSGWITWKAIDRAAPCASAMRRL